MKKLETYKKKDTNMIDLHYIGHSAFEIKNGDKAVLIDPLVSVNDKFDWKEEPITDILLTHAHGDHLGEALEIAKEKDIEITAVAELAGYCKEQGAKSKPIGLGAWINFSWGRAVLYLRSILALYLMEDTAVLLLE